MDTMWWIVMVGAAIGAGAAMLRRPRQPVESRAVVARNAALGSRDFGAEREVARRDTTGADNRSWEDGITGRRAAGPRAAKSRDARA